MEKTTANPFYSFSISDFKKAKKEDPDFVKCLCYQLLARPSHQVPREALRFHRGKIQVLHFKKLYNQLTLLEKAALYIN